MINNILKLILLTVAALAPVYGQATTPVKLQPDCVQYIWLTGAGSNSVIDNRQTGCQGWVLAYNSYGFSALSLTFQSAPSASATAPSTFITYAGTTITGINPNTSVTQTTWSGVGYQPWLRVNLAGLTGTGTVSGVLYGWRNAADAITAAGGATVTQYTNGAATAAPVGIVSLGWDGANVRALSTTVAGILNIVCTSGCSGGTQYTNGAATATPTVNVSAGWDGANVRALLTDTTGRQIAQGPVLVGAVPSTARPMLLGLVNEAGGTVQNGIAETSGGLKSAITIKNGTGSSEYAYHATLSATLTMTAAAATITQLIALTSTQSIRIGSLVAGLGAANTAAFSIVAGTGSNCGTGTTVLATFGNSPVAVSYPVPGSGFLVAPVSNAVCIQSGATTTTDWNINAIYAKF